MDCGKSSFKGVRGEESNRVGRGGLVLWGVRGVVVRGGVRTPEGMKAGAAHLSFFGCCGGGVGVVGVLGGEKTPEGMKAGAAHFHLLAA